MHDVSQRKKQEIYTVALLIVAIILGSGYSIAQYLLDLGFHYATLLLLQFLIATVVIGVICGKTIRRELRRDMLKAGFIIGGTLFAALYPQTIGLDLSTPSNNAFILSSNVVIVPFVWWGVTKKRPDNVLFLASVLSLVGLGTLSIDISEGLTFRIGDLISFAAAILLAAQIVLTGVLASKMDYRVLVFLQFASATFWAATVFIATGGVRQIPALSTDGQVVG